MGWYVLSCRPGGEAEVIHACRQFLSPQAMEDVFQFSYERMRKYLGDWHVDTCPMFPGRVFLQSSCPELLLKELEAARLGETLETDEGIRKEAGGILLPVKPEEMRRMQSLCGSAHHMGLSFGNLQEGNFRVMRGPLTGREGWIRKLDLHKRIAILNLKLSEEGREIWAGIEIGKNS